MENFIFGTLSTRKRRVERALSMRRDLWHGSQLQPPMPRPNEAPTAVVRVKSNIGVRRVIIHITEPAEATIALSVAETKWDLIDWCYYQVWSAELPPQPEGVLVRYSVEAERVDGVVISAETPTFAYLVGDPSPPAWTDAAIVYQIFPDRFAADSDQTLPDYDDPNKIFGGTLCGIISRLDYVADLGFNTIWLNPFFPDHTHHGYHARDYFSVNPRLGTLDELRELRDEAKKRNIRLIIDFVANHWGSNHPTFQDAVTNRDSVYHDWYNWQSWPEKYETFFGVADLPQVNTNHPAARDYLLDAARFWAEFGFDGFRLDYAVGPTLAFWSAFRQAVRAANPEAWIFGEVVEGPDSQVRYIGRFDGSFDFMLAQSLRATFALQTRSLIEFDQFLTQHEAWMPANFSRPSFFDNHDMDRFLYLAGGDLRKLKLVAACQFTLQGQPVLYYGTEVGVTQRTPMHAPDSFGMAEGRRPMRWGADQNSELHAYFRKLIHLRRDNPVLWRGKRETLFVDKSCYVYRRFDAASEVIVGLNLGEAAREIVVQGEILRMMGVSAEIQIK
ncbi:MAG: alpha-amylase family glycosyl hydrolase [Candidatus Promineifilaceae bacterium]